MTRNVFPNSHVRSDLFSKRNPPQANERRERYVGAAPAKRTLCWDGVLNTMRERVGKKQLRQPTLSLRSLAWGGLYFERRSDRTRELEKTLRLIILFFLYLGTFRIPSTHITVQDFCQTTTGFLIIRGSFRISMASWTSLWTNPGHPMMWTLKLSTITCRM